MTTRRLVGLALAAALAAACLSACEQDGRESAGSEPLATNAARPLDQDSLTIKVAQPAGQWRTYTLGCDPPGGTHPTPEAACEVLAALEPPFVTEVAPSDSAACTPLPGQERAVISGTWDGVAVTAKLDRSTTCAALTWDLLGVVLAPVQQMD